MIFDDIWLFSYKMVNKVQEANPEYAYTIVALGSVQNTFGYVCVVKNTDGYQLASYSIMSSDSMQKIEYYLLRMR